MPVVVCPKCDRKLQLPDDTLAREAQCPVCGGAFVAESAGLVRGVTVRPVADAAPPAPAPTGSTAPRTDGRQEPAPTVRGDVGRRLTTGRLVVLILTCLGLLAAGAFVGIVVYQKSGASNYDRILGRWKLIEMNGKPFGAEFIFEFAPGGRARVDDVEGTYTIDGHTLRTIMPGGARTEGSRIISLSDRELVLEVKSTGERLKYNRVAK
jgi:hypothetical protein